MRAIAELVAPFDTTGISRLILDGEPWTGRVTTDRDRTIQFVCILAVDGGYPLDTIIDYALRSGVVTSEQIDAAIANE